jgi:hypothetical protein
MKGGHTRPGEGIFARQPSLEAVVLESSAGSHSCKSVTVEEKTLVVQEGMERVLSSHRLSAVIRDFN